MLAVGIGLVAGLLIGSFVAALTWRWPAGRSIVSGRSHCDHCNAPLRPLDLVPVVSFVLLGGRCRACSGRISPRHLWIELAAGGIGALALAAAPNVTGVLGAAFGWALLALVVLDIEHFWLPDRIVLPLLVAGLAASLSGPPSLADRLIGAAAGYAALATIAAVYRSRTGRTGLGGGDPKLLAAIGAWLGWRALPLVVVAAAVVGLALVAVDWIRGRPVNLQSRVPLGALLASAAFALWLLRGFGSFPW